MRLGERQPFGECRHELAPAVDDFSDGVFTEPVGNTAVEAERLKAPLHPDRARRVTVVLVGEKPGECFRDAALPVGVEVRRIAVEERPHMMIAETVLLLHEIACLPRGMSEQFGAAGVVGGVLNRLENEFVEAALREPVDCGKGVMEGAAARRGDGLGEFGKELVDEVMAAGVSGNCQGRDRAGRCQGVIDFGVGGE